MFMEDAAGMAFPLQQLRKLAVAGVNDLGSLKSETKPLSQAAATKQRQKLQTRALQKTAPPPVASSKPSTEAPKPLDISMPKLAAVQKLQLLLTKKAWEWGDATGTYSNKPLMYVDAARSWRKIPDDPVKLKNKAMQALRQHLKTLPEQQKLHWLENEAVVGQRSWYNPMRYVAGADILDTKEHTLGRGSTDKDIAAIVDKMLLDSDEESLLTAYQPAGNYNRKQANVVQPPNNYRLLPAAPNITTTTPVQRAQNLHADKTDGNGVGGNMNAGSARINSVVNKIGPLGMDGTVNGNAGQFVRNAGAKLAVHKLAKLLRK